MKLVRDVLDKAIVDRNGRPMGRADNILLECRKGAPPRVSAIELGPSVLGARLHPRLGRWLAALEYALGIDAGRPVRIAFDRVLQITHAIKVDLTITETAAGTVEDRVRRWIGRILRTS